MAYIYADSILSAYILLNGAEMSALYAILLLHVPAIASGNLDKYIDIYKSIPQLPKDSNSFTSIVTISSTIRNEKRSIAKTYTHSVRKNKQYLLKSELLSSSPSFKFLEYYVSRNENYMFQAEKSPAGKYVMTNLIQPAPEYELSFQKVTPHAVSLACSRFLGTSPSASTKQMNGNFLNKQLDFIAKLEDLSISSITETDGAALIIFTFTRNSSDWKDSGPLKGNGEVTIDTNNYCIVKKYRLVSTNQKVSIIDECFLQSYKYETGVREKIVKCNEIVTANGIAIDTEYVYETKHDSNYIEDSVFTLSALGLPEPISSSSRQVGVPWYLYVTMAGVLCFVLAIFLIRSRDINQKGISEVVQ